MGQEQSLPIDESIRPQTLRARSVEAVAKYILSGRAKKILVMVGAGISTSAGIPDFRSPDTGLYANLARLNLPYAEAVFDISFFRTNPLPFYTLAHELYPGKYRPTVSHAFIRMLSDKGLLLKQFSQNVDCLDREAGVPHDKIVDAHGSFARQSCIECHSSYPKDLMKRAIDLREVPHCQTPQCNGLVKPEIVFFGEQLPEDFHRNRNLPSEADLCIVMGTSLSVQPFASLPSFCADGVPRVLINLERVGDIGSRADDVIILGDCDTGVRKLAASLGWADELESIWESTKPDLVESPIRTTSPPKSKDEELQDEIANLTKEVDDSLRISNNFHTSSMDHLSKQKQQKQEKSVPPRDFVANGPAYRNKSEAQRTGHPKSAFTDDPKSQAQHSTAQDSPESKKIDSSLTASTDIDNGREPAL